VFTLILGGVKAGKSTYAARLAAQAGGPVTVLATGVAGDQETVARIDAHRRARPVTWTVVEEPLAIAAAVEGHGGGALLLDSVDSWLFNRMEAAGGAGATYTPQLRHELLESCDGELMLLGDWAHVIAVSAEVGLSLLPMWAYGRAFTDVLGQLNQRLAARADRCYLLVAGVPVPVHSYRAAAE
jgi:adenosylcobinamide kinase/adenosylcobinamide-phosphate guanylyltransferase